MPLPASGTLTRGRRIGQVRHVVVTDELIEQIRAMGVQPMVRDLVDPKRPTWHSRPALAKAFQEVIAACHSTQQAQAQAQAQAQVQQGA